MPVCGVCKAVILPASSGQVVWGCPRCRTPQAQRWTCILCGNDYWAPTQQRWCPSCDRDRFTRKAEVPNEPTPAPDPMQRALADNEKKLARLKKFFAHAARREGNENESRAFALRIFKTLEADALPLRFLVMKGAEVRVIPTHLIKHPHNTSVLRTVKAHQRQMFTEGHRVKDVDGLKAIDKGWLAFDRHGYTVFVKLADVQVFF